MLFLICSYTHLTNLYKGLNKGATNSLRNVYDVSMYNSVMLPVRCSQGQSSVLQVCVCTFSVVINYMYVISIMHARFFAICTFTQVLQSKLRNLANHQYVITYWIIIFTESLYYNCTCFSKHHSCYRAEMSQ